MTVLQEAPRNRETRARRTRRRRKRRIAEALAVVVVALAVLMALMASGVSDRVAQQKASAAAAAPPKPPSRPTYALAPATTQFRIHFKQLLSGLLFDIRTGRVLWQQDPARALPIASLTKMMTALIVVEHARPDEHVMITRLAKHYSGSGVGLLPLGKQVSLLSLLYGLLLPSGNDAAIALAQHVAGDLPRFIGLMNDRAGTMGLRCTHFNSVSGIVDQDNYSCARDLAVMAHALLEQPLLARIVGSHSAILPFPIKGGKLYLYNNNPLMYLGYPGIDGVKTGYTVAAGSCLVATARRGRAWYGVVLLHSGNAPDQAQKLLNRAFATG